MVCLQIQQQKEEYDKVISLGQSAVSETETIRENSAESERQISQVTSRWDALNQMIDTLKYVVI